MQSSTEITFRQLRSRFIHDAVVLRHDRVIIRTGAAELADERHIPLEEISPLVEFDERQYSATFWVSQVLAILFAAAAWKVSGPGHLSFAMTVLFGSLAFGSVIGGFVSRRLPVATVRSRAGEILFQLFREQSVAADYEVFLLELQRRIHARCNDTQP
jgi:hypothetical protein